MTRYALVQKGVVAKYPYSFAALCRDNPNVSFPRDPSDEKLAEFGVVAIATAPRPSVGLTKNIAEGMPILIGETWTQVWNIVDASAEEIAERQASADNEIRRASVKADAFVANFIAMSPAEVAALVETNITSLASAKTVIAKLAQIVLILARREFSE